MSNAVRPMMPSDVHEIMREVVEADVLDMTAISERLLCVERQRDHERNLADITEERDYTPRRDSDG